MKEKYTDYSAYVSRSNTAETDMMEKVWHTVDFTQNGKPKSVNVLATDPMDAIICIRVQHEAGAKT